MTSRSRLLATAASCTVVLSSAAQAQQWNGSQSSDWNDGANWNGGNAPSGGGTVNITAPPSSNWPEFNAASNSGSLTIGNEFWVGNGGGNVGQFTLSGGNLTVNNWVAIGRDGSNGIANMTGGVWTKGGGDNTRFIVGANGSGGSGTLNQSGGSIVVQTGITWIGENQTGTHNLSGSGQFTTSQYVLGVNGGVSGTANLNGGTLSTGQITRGNGNATVTFNGTQIVATANQANFINVNTANVGDGGLKIDVQSFNVGSGSNFNGTGTGGLTLSGTTGILSLSGTNTWAGPNTITGGTLLARTPGSLPGWESGLSVPTGAGYGGAIGNATGFSEAQFNTLLTNATFAAGSHVALDSDGIASFSGNIAALAGTNDIGLLKTGPNVLTLTGTNTHTGDTRVLSGTLIAANDTSLDLSKISVSSGAGFGGRIGGTGFADQAELVATLGTVNIAANSFVGIDTTNGDFTLTGDAGALNANTPRLHKVGANTLTLTGNSTFTAPGGNDAGLRVDQGTLRLAGPGTTTTIATGELWVGSNTGAGGHLVLEDTTLNVASWLSIGRGNGNGNLSTITATNATIQTANFSSGYDAGLATNNSETLITLNNTQWTNPGNTNIGESAGAVSTLTLNGNSTYTAGNRIMIGQNTGATGHVVLNDSSGIVQTSGWLAIGNNGTGTMTVKDNAYYTNTAGDFNVADVTNSHGTLNLQDNGKITAATTYIGKGNGATGIFNLSGGEFIAGGNTRLGQNANVADGNSIGIINQTGGIYRGNGGDFQIGVNGNGIWNQSGGEVHAGGWVAVGRYNGANGNNTGQLNVSGGVFTQTAADRFLMIGEEGRGSLTISGTGRVVSHGEVSIGHANNGHGTVNLDGGSLSARIVRRGNQTTGTAILNFNGGTLEARESRTDYLQGLNRANVRDGGAVIDTGSHTITINQNLEHSNIEGDAATDGGLTKTGGGTLILGGNNTYTGLTTVQQGTLTLAVGASIAASSGIHLEVGTTLDVSAIDGWTLGENQTLSGSGALASDFHFDEGSFLSFSSALQLASGSTATFGEGFGIANLSGLDASTANGTYTLIGGDGTVDPTGLDNFGFENAYDLGGGKLAWFETGSLQVFVIPEPSVALLGGLGALALLRRRRS